MRKPIFALTIAILAAVTSVSARAADQPAAANPDQTALTIYSQADPAGFDPQQWVYNARSGNDNADPSTTPGFGVVKETRTVPLVAGLNTLPFTDVAALIDPTSVTVKDLTDPNTDVLEQRFKFDLMSASKLLEKYVDQPVTVFLAGQNGSIEKVSGTLLSANDAYVLQTPTGLRVLQSSAAQQISLGDVRGGLLTKPTLEWDLQTNTGGQHQLLTTYQTKGLTWIADYNLVLNGDDTAASLAAWVSLVNLSGKSYEHAQLKLIAGTINQVQPPQPIMYRAIAGAMEEDAAKSFQEKTFFEYHMYTLPRPTDIPQNATEQISLFPTKSDVKVEKLLIYAGQADWVSQYSDQNLNLGQNSDVESSGQPSVYVRFQNKKDNGLGIPLPKGKVRVFKEDPADGTQELLGEDLLWTRRRMSR